MELNVREILNILPHRYPFLFIDRVIEADPGKSAVGVKNVTCTEPYFQGHFPGRPIVPGVLIIESLAQLTAVMYCLDIKKNLDDKTDKLSEHVGYLAGINKFRFKGIVCPGDQLILSATLKETFGNISNVAVSAKCNGKIVASGVITVSQK